MSGQDCIPPLLSAGLCCAPMHRVQPPLSAISDSNEAPILLGRVECGAHALVGHGAIVGGGATDVKVGDYTIVMPGAVVRSLCRTYVNQSVAVCSPSVAVGVFSYIGMESVCECEEIGSFVRIEDRCAISGCASVPDGVWIKAGSWVPAEVQLTPYTVYEGVPVTAKGRLNADAFRLLQMEFIREKKGTSSTTTTE